MKCYQIRNNAENLIWANAIHELLRPEARNPYTLNSHAIEAKLWF